MYFEKRRQFESQQRRFRVRCLQCHQPDFSCYCQHVRPFNSPIDFVILIHPVEMRRRIATGRMAHLCLKGSFIMRGHYFTDDVRVNTILADPRRHNVLLYPRLGSTNLSELSEKEKAQRFCSARRLTVFVIDGTWSTARKMVRSQNLLSLPRICFTPDRPSNFRVRKQPRENFCSTIEAIHHTIELLGPSQRFDTRSRPHDHLLEVFNVLVEQQLQVMRHVDS